MMRPFLSFHFSTPAQRAARIAIAAGTFAGLAVLGACADTTKTVAAPSDPRNSTIFGEEGVFAFAKIVKVCVDAGSPAGTYRFTNSGFLSGFDLNGVPDGSDGGDGTTVETPVGDGIEYTVGVGACQTVLTRTEPDSFYPASSDSWSGITLTATTIPATAVYSLTNCLLDAGTKPAVPNPCDTGNNPTRAYANWDHGSQITFVFVPAPPQEVIPLFVIGDIEPHGIGDVVNFWGSQWWKNNPMSQFTTKGWPSFKGFAGTVDPTPREGAPCGTWNSRVGNSPPPPATIPDLVGVIVSNNVIKIGPGEGGGIQQIVIVDSDGGYSSNPGHDGNGPVVEIVCGQAR